MATRLKTQGRTAELRDIFLKGSKIALSSIALARPLGLAGVALGTAIPNVLFAGLILVHACRELETPAGHYLRYVVARATLGALPVLALLLWFKLDVRSLGWLAGAGVAMMLLFAVTWIFFVYRNDPCVDLRVPLARVRVGGRA